MENAGYSDEGLLYIQVHFGTDLIESTAYIKETSDIHWFQGLKWKWLHFSLAVDFVTDYKYLRIVFIVLSGLDQPVVFQALC